MSSIACLTWSIVPAACARRWRTPGWQRASTPVTTARTIRASATGLGPADEPAPMRVLVLNPGSSTLKGSAVTVGSRDAFNLTVDWPPGDDASTAPGIVRGLLDQLPSGADGVGYRVVHGGSAYRAASLVDD